MTLVPAIAPVLTVTVVRVAGIPNRRRINRTCDGGAIQFNPNIDTVRVAQERFAPTSFQVAISQLKRDHSGKNCCDQPTLRCVPCQQVRFLSVTIASAGLANGCVRLRLLRKARTWRHVVARVVHAKRAAPTSYPIAQPAKDRGYDHRSDNKAQEHSDFRHPILRRANATAVMLRPKP
jgi:hypothetical protein